MAMDVPDWEKVVTVVPSFVAGDDVPDWEKVVIGPGNTPIGGGYLSLTGPGETQTPGDLTQAGGFTVDDSVGHGITFQSAAIIQSVAEDGFTVSDNSSNGIVFTERGSVGIVLVDGGSYTPTTNGIFLLEQGNGPIILQTAGFTSAPGIQLENDGHTGIAIRPGSGGLSISIASVPVYADNAAAIAGGLVAGDIYRTGADPDPLCIVH